MGKFNEDNSINKSISLTKGISNCSQCGEPTSYIDYCTKKYVCSEECYKKQYEAFIKSVEKKPEDKKIEEIVNKIVGNSEVLQRLSNERVFSLMWSASKLYIGERCDDYYYDNLDKEDCIELAKVFAKLAEVL